jgi:dethiobiotin synthetase
MGLRFSCFVTGTDTGVGKTLVSSAFVHALTRSGVKAVGMKPIAAGSTEIDGRLANEDVDTLAAEAGIVLPVQMTSPYILREACAPHVAAALEGVRIEKAVLLDAYRQTAERAEAVVVEGVGGFRVPLTDDFDTADLAAGLQLDVILVVGLRLGCLSHALLSAESIAARGLKLVGWVANQVDPAMLHQQASVAALQARLPAPLLGVVPWMATPSAAAAREHIAFDLLPSWPVPRG